MNPLRVLDIVEGTSVDGPGLRTSIYFAGCSHHCPGCHNPESWDPNGGKPISVDEIFDVVREADFNVTFSGGDPLMQAEPLTELARKIKDELAKTIWLYTGFTIEQVRGEARFSELLKYIDVIVEGPFVEHLRDISLRFRGSSNQRIIDLRENKILDLKIGL